MFVWVLNTPLETMNGWNAMSIIKFSLMLKRKVLGYLLLESLKNNKNNKKYLKVLLKNTSKRVLGGQICYYL